VKKGEGGTEGCNTPEQPTQREEADSGEREGKNRRGRERVKIRCFRSDRGRVKRPGAALPEDVKVGASVAERSPDRQEGKKNSITGGVSARGRGIGLIETSNH